MALDFNTSEICLDQVQVTEFGGFVKVTTHGVYSSHMAEAGKGDNSAYAYRLVGNSTTGLAS